MRSKSTAATGVTFAVCVICVASLAAQDHQLDPRTRSERLRFFRLEETWVKADPAKTADLASLVDPLNTRTYAFVFYALPPRVLADDFRRFLQTAQRARVDQQIESGTAAARTGLSTLMGLAIESGALSQSVDQQVATLRVNADGLLRFLSNQEVIATCSGDDDQGCSTPSLLKDVDVAATFTVGNGDTKTFAGTSSASGKAVNFSTLTDVQKLTSVTARFAIQNTRDIRSPAYRRKWAALVEANQAPLGALGQSLLTYVESVTDKVQTLNAAGERPADAAETEYALWRAATRTRLQLAKSEPELEEAYATQLDDLLSRMRRLSPDFDTTLSGLGDAYLRYLALRRDLASTLITDPALTVEYTYATPLLEPKLHTMKVAWAFSPGNKTGTPQLLAGTPGFRRTVANPGTFTFNASVDYFHDPQPTDVGGGTSHWKSAQIALQFDRPLGPGDSAARLSAGAYYQYQFSPAIIIVPGNAAFLSGTSIPLSDAGRRVLSEKGAVVATQVLLTLRLGNSGLQVPMGISWANRSELATGNEVRGHVGFTFDTTQLLLLPGLR